MSVGCYRRPHCSIWVCSYRCVGSWGRITPLLCLMAQLAGISLLGFYRITEKRLPGTDYICRNRHLALTGAQPGVAPHRLYLQKPSG